MFLVAITKDEISHNFQNVQLETFKIHPFIITVVTDNFLSKYNPIENGFSVIESPRFLSPKTGKIIFSQGIYTQQDRSFTIGRSTISGRPIFYTNNVRGDFYCSTHISLLRTAGVPIKEDTTVLPEFFIYRHIMPPKTLYKNIKRLLMGEQLLIRIENDKCVIHPLTHYIPRGEKQKIISITEGAAQLYNYLSETLKRLEPAKDETTILLSGGIDSSVITTIYKKIFSLDTSYSTGYPFESTNLNDEKRYAISAAKALKMNHHYYEPSSQEFLSGIIEGIFHAEEPLHHLQSVLLYLLWKNGIPKEQKIILCAQGAGSTFGYNDLFYLNEKRKKLFYRLLTTNSSLLLLKSLSKIIGRGMGYIDNIEKLHRNYPLNTPENAIWSWMDFGYWDWVRTYFNVTSDQIIKDRYNFIKEFSNMSMYDIWSRYSLYGDEDVTLAIWSKIGEGNKKIIYFPYYDIDVLNYAFSIPWRLKLQKYRVLTKEIAQQSKLPKFIIDRPKLGFSVNSLEWAKKGGIFEPLIPIISKVFNDGEIRHMQITSDWRKVQTFWNMVNYSIWKRLHIYNEPLDVLLEELDNAI
jgi:asparagine synthase (glutamine-hydrolysing)